MSRRFTHQRAATTVRVVALLAAVLVVGGCAHRTGTGTPSSSAETGVVTSTGYTNQLVDQPLPFPALHPKMNPEGGCDWLADAMPALASVKLTHWKRAPMTPMCQLWGDEKLPYAVQVRIGGQYTPFTLPDQLDSIVVAGLHGRRYVLGGTLDDTFCSIELDLRAYTTLAIDAFDFDQNNPTSADNKANCEVAERVGDILARRYVPLAGGTPWPDTPQQPQREVLDRLKPCGFVEDTIYTDINDDSPDRADTRLGKTCTYRGKHGTLETLITTSTSGLAEFPMQFPEPPAVPGGPGVPAPPASSSDQRQRVRDVEFGGHYPSRQEHSPPGKKDSRRSCGVAIETESRHVIAITYTSVRSIADNCAIARINMSTGLLDAIAMESEG